MNVRKPILLLTTLLAWLGGVESVWADPTVSYWDGQTKTPLTDADIDTDGYYKITTAAQWAWLNADWQQGSRNVKLCVDLDMGSYKLTDIIGGTSQSVSGVIDGKGHTIYNLFVEKNNSWETGGIVGYMYNCTLKDLHVVNGLVKSTQSGDYGIGGLVGGYGNHSTITNCSFQGIVDAGDKDYVGGIVGKPTSPGWVITDCYFDGTVIGYNYVGTIIGQIGSDTVESGNTYSSTSTIVIGGVAIYGSGTDIKIGKLASDFTTYTITKASVTGGSFSVNVAGAELTRASVGTPVTISITPANGYYTRSVTVSGSVAVATTKLNDNEYTFTMPASDVTVSVSFGAYIANVSISDISAPVTLSAFDNDASCTTTGVASISSVTWNNGSTTVSGSAQVGIAYTVEVILTPSSGYRFTNSATATVNGSPASSVTKSGDNLIVTYTFPATVKLNPIITTAPTASAIIYGQTLANSTLSGGVANTAGTFTWTDNTIAPNVSDSQNTGYGVTFTPADYTNYNTATTTVQLTIHKRPITAITITVDDIVYDASAHNTINQLTVKYGDFTIPNSNYTVEPTSITEAGIYTLTIVGTSNLIGSTTKELKVTKDITTYSSDIKISASDVQTTPIPTQIYDGTHAPRPPFYIFDNDKLLAPSNDYTSNYGTNNTEGANTGTVTIYGAGVYSGSTTLTFAIVNEYFTEDNTQDIDIDYHTTSSTTVAVGNKTHTTAIATATTGIVIPASITHAGLTFQVTDIENGAFTGCSSLRYIDFSEGTDFVPTTLLRNIAASPFYGVPKQALVYLHGTTFTGENYVYYPGTGTAYYCDVFKIYDELNGNQQGYEEANDYKWAFENPHDFTANTIINTRMLTAEQHYTTCLPYDLVIPADMKAYTLSSTSDKLLSFEEVTTGTLTAYTPYVITTSTSGQLFCTTDAVVPTLMASDADAKKLGEVTGGNFTMDGTMRYIDGPDAEGFYIMQGKNASGVCTWKKVESSASNTGASPENPCVLPMRAYIKSGTALSHQFMGSTFTNGVSERATTGQTEDGSLYDLQGRKIQTPQCRGIYIKNGRKVIINKM